MSRALHEAINEGNEKLALNLIKEGASLSNYSTTLLGDAVQKGMFEVVKTMNVNTQTHVLLCDIGLVRACQYDQFKIAEWLLTNGAKAEIWHGAALREVVSKSNLKMLTLILEQGGDASIDNNSLIEVAANKRNWDIARLLIAHGADIRAERDILLRSVFISEKSTDIFVEMLSYYTSNEIAQVSEQIEYHPIYNEDFKLALRSFILTRQLDEVISSELTVETVNSETPEVTNSI
ncbi:MAG: hypothetical protein HAW67_05385 [Endozoicomonadaceae bacterium]|nr:hypothetical protein [Endozoicomonadaceae bacterium]